jgi:inorganic phosphate transporter, PiT family
LTLPPGGRQLFLGSQTALGHGSLPSQDLIGMTLVLSVILIALIFEYINGFHDTANSIATVVSTKVLTPAQAVILASVMNLAGAMWGTKVALTISSGLVNATVVTMTSNLILCSLLGAIAWNLITWWFGMASSSSHALIGGLCGAAVAATHNNWHAIIWSQPNEHRWFLWKGLLWKVIVPMVLSPLAGYVIGFVLMALLYIGLRNQKPTSINRFFGKAQILSSGAMGFMHGTNDAQKTMGIIALVLLGATKAGELDQLPGVLSFLKTYPAPPGTEMHIASWIKVVCAIAMAAGTAIGGWRIINTLGRKVVKLHPIMGFAAQSSSSTIIAAASIFGIPISTTHNISASIMGVGTAKRFGAVNLVVIERMVWAWLMTLPASGIMAYLFVRILQRIGWV